MPQRCDCKSVGSDSRCPPTCFRVTGVRIYRRKLLAHERDFRKHFATRATFRVGTMPRDIDATKSRSRVDRKRDNVAKDTMHENDAGNKTKNRQGIINQLFPYLMHTFPHVEYEK